MSMPLPAEGTFLLISDAAGSILPLWAARGIKEDLRVIGESKAQFRDVNGNLTDFSLSIFRKYALTISCRDTSALAIDGLFPGTQITVTPTQKLVYPTGGTSARPVYAGSSNVIGNYTYYRPILTMLIGDIQKTFDEYGGLESWKLELEEV